MNKQLWFTSTFFDVKPEEDKETNPDRYGKALAYWVGEQLKQRGVQVESIFPEDFGWVVMVSRKPFMLWVGCGNEYGSKTRWSIFVEVKPSLRQTFFKKANTQPVVTELEALLAEIAKIIPDVQEISWE